MAASSAEMDFTASPAALFALFSTGFPKAPKRMLEKDRFMAFDMTMERMKPEAPSRAPAMMSTSFPMAKPVADEASPAYELRSDITTGMSAPPIGRTMETPMSSPRTHMR